MCQSCSSYNACRWPVAFGRGRGSRAQKLPAQSSRAIFRSASRCPTPPGPWHRRATLSVRPPLGVAFASAPSASSAGFLQTGLSVAIVVADGADRADGVLDISRPRLNLMSALNTNWNTVRDVGGPRARGDLVSSKGYPGNLMALRWTASRGASQAPANRSCAGPGPPAPKRRGGAEGCLLLQPLKPATRGKSQSLGGLNKAATRA